VVWLGRGAEWVVGRCRGDVVVYVIPRYRPTGWLARAGRGDVMGGVARGVDVRVVRALRALRAWRWRRAPDSFTHTVARGGGGLLCQLECLGAGDRAVVDHHLRSPGPREATGPQAGGV